MDKGEAQCIRDTALLQKQLFQTIWMDKSVENDIGNWQGGVRDNTKKIHASMYIQPLCPTVSRRIQVHCSLWNQLKEEKNYICIQIYIELELGRFMGDGDQKHPRAGMNVLCSVYVPKYEVCLIVFPQMEISYEQDISSFLTYLSCPNCL